MKRLLLILPLLLVASPNAAFGQSKLAICAERDAELVEMGKQDLDEAYQAFNEKWWKRLGIKGAMPSSPMEAFIAISSYCSNYKN
jgi:predicted nucleic acid binding AN1-type Zn finger protein